MRISPRRFSTLWTLLAVFAVVGCSNDGAPQKPAGNGSAGNGSAGNSDASPGFAMHVTIQKGTREDYETELGKTFLDPTAAQIEEQVRAQDWKNAMRRPHVGLAKTTQGRIAVVRVEGVLGAPDPEAALRAKWIGVDGEQEFLRRSPPLESLDAAIQLLLAFRNDDPNLKTLTDWKQEATE